MIKGINLISTVTLLCVWLGVIESEKGVNQSKSRALTYPRREVGLVR